VNSARSSRNQKTFEILRISCRVSFRVSSAYLPNFSLFELGMKSNLREFASKIFPLSVSIHYHDRFICVTFFFTKMDMDALCLVFLSLGKSLNYVQKQTHFSGPQLFIMTCSYIPMTCSPPLHRRRMCNRRHSVGLKIRMILSDGVSGVGDEGDNRCPILGQTVAVNCELTRLGPAF